MHRLFFYFSKFFAMIIVLFMDFGGEFIPRVIFGKEGCDLRKGKHRLAAWLMALILLVSMWLPTGVMAVGAGQQSAQSFQIMETTDIISSSFYLVDNVTGRVLMEKNIHEKRPVAGLAKMVTALVVLEKGNTNETITVSEEAGSRFGRDNKVLNLKPGEEMNVQDLIYCMLLAPSNEAAWALAEYIGDGDVAAFVELMNQLAQTAGCSETVFVNPTGIDEDGQYSTAYDMYLLARYAMANPRFMELCNAVHKRIDATNESKQRYFLTDNRLISTGKESTYYYGPAKGMAYGYSANAGYCLVTTAKRNGMELVCVAMGGKVSGEQQLISSYTDAKTAMEKCFDNFKITSVAKAGDVVKEMKVVAGALDHVALGPQQDVKLILPNEAKEEDITREYVLAEQATAPVKKGDVLGTMKVSYQGVEQASYALSALSEVRQSIPGFIGYHISLFFKNMVVRILIVLFILFVIFYIYMTIRINKRRQEQMRQNKMRKSQKRY